MPWHPGERAVQRRAGVTDKADAIGDPTAAIPPVAQDFLRERPWLVVGAPDAGGRLWATALHGPPGFLDARDERTIHVAARPAPGDPLADVLEREAEVGAIAIDPPTRRRMRLNGRSRPDGEGGLLITTEQVYANCPKYISARVPERVGDAAPDDAPPPTAQAELGPVHRTLLERTDTFFIATRAPGHGADASHRGGNPGFVVVHDSRRLTFPDYRGNSMFQTLGNLELDPAVGLLVVDFERGDLLHVSGRARVVWDSDRIAAFPRAERLVDVDVDRVVHRRAAAPLRWQLLERSKVSPPAPVRA